MSLCRLTILSHLSLSLSHSPPPPLSPSRSSINIHTDRFVLPWPLRLLETDQCVVELHMTSTIDLEAPYDTCYSNYHATMMWYGQDGTQSRLDIRKLIRKQLKQVCEWCFKILLKRGRSLVPKFKGGGGTDAYSRGEPHTKGRQD